MSVPFVTFLFFGHRDQFEINALGTTWSLLLNKPYDDGGGEDSKRVDPDGKFGMARGLYLPIV